jgi:hypothetical protein
VAQHRPGARGLFARERCRGARVDHGHPDRWRDVHDGERKQFRRVLMPKTKNHIYFEMDETRGLIIVHALWGAPRGRGPQL